MDMMINTAKKNMEVLQDMQKRNEEMVRELRQLRDEVHDVRRTLDRIADALEE